MHISHARHGDWLRIPDAGPHPVEVVATYPRGLVVALPTGNQRYDYADLEAAGAEYAPSPGDTLIAAAPELLEACRAWLEAMAYDRKCGGIERIQWPFEDAEELTDRALAKAEGRE